MSAALPSSAERPAGASEGFTLLEVLIALAILGTAVVVSIQGVSQGLRLLKAAGDQQQAMIVADQQARAMLVPTEGTESGADGRFSWQRTAKIVEAPELTPASGPQKWHVFEISVVVTWDEQRRLEVATLRTVPASDPTKEIQAIVPPQGGGPAAGAGAAAPGAGAPAVGPGGLPRSGGQWTGTGSRLPGATTR